ncbi:carbohydrate esterase family 4 protein [Mucor lusitanicus]|uniref:Carbohydrate esterase family 4 protein n=2 Tax=Mucor circinelloides f. lusitanicus TaxID=29924 RepID=A0A162MPT0_MUCCL|nr:carbohydrate esterase family 4 protein [Mucor lusitanicus]OAD04045.1 carbohydrate esterase family 4 protein [Mucor lusitanicus CBS 277.49]
MRTASLLLTLAYAATLVMGRPTTTTDAAKATETSSSGQVQVFEHCNRPGVFALTFDDGPDKYSWGLAKTLQEQGVKATFFLNGENSVNVLSDSTMTDDGEKTYLEVIKHYYDSGHEVASHTLKHMNLVGLTEEQVKEQMNKQSDIIYKAIGKRVRLMRPPEGVIDDVSSKVLSELGYYDIMWDVDTKDWEHKGLKAEQARIREVMDKDVANKTMGHIALEHDIHEDTVKTLVPWFVDYVKQKGYEFVTVSDCIGVEPYFGDANSTTTTADASAATEDYNELAHGSVASADSSPITTTPTN